MTDFLLDTFLMLGVLGIYAGVSIVLSVAGMAAYLKWEEVRRGKY